jgi:hypothetical protein
MPALNAPVLEALAIEVPEITAHRSRLEQAEQRAVAALMLDVKKRARAAGKNLPGTGLAALLPQANPYPALTYVPGPHTVPHWQRAGEQLFAWVPQAHAQESASDNLGAISGMGFVAGALLGNDEGKVAPTTDTSHLNSDMPGQDGAEASFRVSVGADGRTTKVLSTSVEQKSMSLEAKSRLAVTTAALCPDAAGKVNFTVKVSQGGHAGSGNNVAYDRESEVKISVTVGDDAEIVEADLLTQQGERSTAGGHQVYVETAADWHRVSAGYWKLLGDPRMVRASSQANVSDLPMEIRGISRSLVIADGALAAAKSHWQSGACIRIDAKAPDSIKAKTRSEIPVRVLHKIEGGEVVAKVDVALTGGASISPEVIAATPGTLTHVAPDQRRAKIEIKLTANSRRGRATELLKLSINEDQYSIDGGAGEFHGSGTVCDLASPFTVEGSGVVVKFTPSSAQGGSYSYSGTMSSFPVFGQGNYTVKYNGDVAVAITATGPGSVKTPGGVVSGNGTEKYTLQPTGGVCD